MTCRSARRNLVAAPDDAREMELVGFDEAASAEYFRYHFPDATSVSVRCSMPTAAGIRGFSSTCWIQIDLTAQ